MDAIARVPVLETIRDAIETRTCVSVVGLPGSGRSDVLKLVREAAEDDDWTVLSVPSHGASTGRPLESLVLAGLVPEELTAVDLSATHVVTDGYQNDGYVKPGPVLHHGSTRRS